MIKVSDYIFQFLKGKGISHVFMLPGGGAMHLVDSLGTSGIEYVCCLHEQAAAIAAEAYGQHTNNIGVALTTSGPGATNAITGVTAGWIDSTPMFILSGQAKRSDLVGSTGVRQIGSQEVQIVDMVKPITKYAAQILAPEEIRYHLERAYAEATTGRPGPVWLSIPLDVQSAIVDETTLHGYETESLLDATQDVDKAIEKTIELLENSNQPLILAGNGIKLANAQDIFYELLNILPIPVQTTWKTIDMFGEEDRLYVGHPGAMGDRGANLILQKADVLISIGSRLDTSLTAFNESNFGKNAKKIIVDIDANELNRMKVRHIEDKVFCDAKVFLEKLLESVKSRIWEQQKKKWKEWLAECHSLREKYPVVTKKHIQVQDKVSAYYFIDVLCKNLTPEDIIVPESSGAAGEITYQAFRVKKGQKMKNAAGLGSMGFGLPYAIGACLANDKKRTVLINGDGAFQMNIQELETLQRLNLPIKIFIWNNEGYASIRAMQKNTFDGRLVASEESSGLKMPDIRKVAKAYGIPVFLAKNNKEMEQVVPEILGFPGVVLCELLISPDETVSPRTKSYRLPDGSMKSSLLEEMWPRIE
ncbi:thiamine pyrophosphate-binding protein [Lachnospiraceae bacterium 29-84]